MMNREEYQAFIKDIQEVLKKHGLAMVFSGNPEHLVKETKHLEGYHMFFTKGEKKVYLRGGEKFRYDNSVTVKLKRANTEDDGN